MSCNERYPNLPCLLVLVSLETQPEECLPVPSRAIWKAGFPLSAALETYTTRMRVPALPFTSHTRGPGYVTESF